MNTVDLITLEVFRVTVFTFIIEMIYYINIIAMLIEYNMVNKSKVAG